MSLDSFKRVLYNDGEGITHGDLADSQDYLLSRLFDQIISKCAPGDLSLGSSVDPGFPSQFNSANAHWAYALSVGAGHPKQGSSNNKIGFGKGTVFQCIGADTGDSPVFLPYTFLGTEEFTVANGDATNDRLDLLQMKLEYVDGDSQSRDFEDATTGVVTSTSTNKKRRIQATISIKQGTPAASPAYPDPDAGYCALAGAYVEATYAGANAFDDPAGASAFLHDLRMPLNVKPYKVRAKDGLGDPAIWVPQTATITVGRSVKANATGFSDLYIECPSTKGRLVGVGIVAKNLPGGANTLGLVSLVEPSGFGDFQDISSIANTTATADYRYAGLDSLEPLRSAVKGIGCPVWVQGIYHREVELFRLGSGTATDSGHIGVKFDEALNSEVYEVVFFVAEGW